VPACTEEKALHQQAPPKLLATAGGILDASGVGMRIPPRGPAAERRVLLRGRSVATDASSGAAARPGALECGAGKLECGGMRTQGGATRTRAGSGRRWRCRGQPWISTAASARTTTSCSAAAHRGLCAPPPPTPTPRRWARLAPHLEAALGSPDPLPGSSLSVRAVVWGCVSFGFFASCRYTAVPLPPLSSSVRQWYAVGVVRFSSSTLVFWSAC